MTARRRLRTALAAAALGVALGGGTRPGARADDAPAGAVPPEVAALVGTPAEEALAAAAGARLAGATADDARQARAELLLAGPAGTRTAARRLAARPADDGARLALVEVLDASPVPAVDDVLGAAADDPRPEVRAVIARALGAGRSGRAVDLLVRLAADPSPAVRAAALRALFALDTPVARTARAELPTDPDADLAALRLRLHRLRADDAPAVRARAAATFAGGRAPRARLEAARLLATAPDPAAVPLLAFAVAETWAAPERALALRAEAGVPVAGYDPVASRLVAVEALLALVLSPTAPLPLRAELLELAADAIARPSRRGCPTSDYEALTTLRQRLPSVGPALAGPLVRRLAAGDVDDPTPCVQLLGALGPDVAVPALGGLVTGGAAVEVVKAAAAELAVAGRVGRDDVADALLAPRASSDVRTAGVDALAREPAARAVPRLAPLLDDADEAVASRAADALADRPEPAARAALEAALEAPPTRKWEQTLLYTLAARPDPAAYALFHRLLTAGPEERRRQVLDAVRALTSRMRGPEAAALVRRAVEEPLGLGPGDLAPALTAVDGEAGVGYVRARWRRARNPEVFVRNLQRVAHPSALDAALEIAAAVGDDQPAVLKALMTVLTGPAARDPARTDPFWRRVLRHPDPDVSDAAVRALPSARHGPLGDLLVPVLADPSRRSTTRTAALAACGDEPEVPPSALLWALASDRLEDEGVRAEAAKALLRRDRPDIRAKAGAWLREGVEEVSDVVEAVATLAGRGATPGEAADLLALWDRELAARYVRPPYFAPTPARDDQEALDRMASLAAALVATRDATTLGELGRRVFDPRFAQWSLEARRYAAVGRVQAGGPLTARLDPPWAAVLLSTEAADPREIPVLPAPGPASELVRALAHGGVPGGALHLVRALEEAAASGRLALFSDAYLAQLLRRVADPGAGAAPRAPDPVADAAADAAVDALEAAMHRTRPVAGAEEAFAVEARFQRAFRRRAWPAAAAAAEEAAALGARTGLCDVPAGRWIAMGREVPKDLRSWLELRARADLLAGAVAASAGKRAEAHEAYRRGLARVPWSADAHQLAASLKALDGFDPVGALLDTETEIDLRRRTGEATAADLARLDAARAATPIR